jgi:hypothetical protein
MQQRLRNCNGLSAIAPCGRSIVTPGDMRWLSGCGGTSEAGAPGARTEDARKDQTRLIERTVSDSIQRRLLGRAAVQMPLPRGDSELRAASTRLSRSIVTSQPGIALPSSAITGAAVCSPVL